MEEFRAREGTGSIFFSPSKIASAKQLQLDRATEKVQERQNRQLKAKEKEAAMARKLETLEQNRRSRLTARETEAALAATRAASRNAARTGQQVSQKDPRGAPGCCQRVSRKAQEAAACSGDGSNFAGASRWRMQCREKSEIG